MKRLSTPPKGWELAAETSQLYLPFLRFPLSDSVMLEIAKRRRNYVAGLCNTLQHTPNLGSNTKRHSP